MNNTYSVKTSGKLGQVVYQSKKAATSAAISGSKNGVTYLLENGKEIAWYSLGRRQDYTDVTE